MVEGSDLESRRNIRKITEGSNPSLSVFVSNLHLKQSDVQCNKFEEITPILNPLRYTTLVNVFIYNDSPLRDVMDTF